LRESQSARLRTGLVVTQYDWGGARLNCQSSGAGFFKAVDGNRNRFAIFPRASRRTNLS
jgi:hypothetical protein